MTILLRMPPGAPVPLPMHSDVEQTSIFDGKLIDEQGACTAGTFVWRPTGNTHDAHFPSGALFNSVFMKPKKFIDEQPTFAKS